MSKASKTIPPFDCIIMDEPETITNPFSGESVVLEPVAVAVYDVIMGAQQFGHYQTVRKGLDWFRRFYPREYMILLD